MQQNMNNEILALGGATAAVVASGMDSRNGNETSTLKEVKRNSELEQEFDSPIGSTKEKLSMRPSMPAKQKSMRLSLPDEPKETNWLLMVFDPEVSNVNEEEW